MPETKKENPVEKLENLSDQEIREKGRESLDRFKEKLKEYSSE